MKICLVPRNENKQTNQTKHQKTNQPQNQKVRETEFFNPGQWVRKLNNFWSYYVLAKYDVTLIWDGREDSEEYPDSNLPVLVFTEIAIIHQKTVHYIVLVFTTVLVTGL